MTPTYLKYLEHGELLQDTATITDLQHNEQGAPIIILDQTIFYPQGGGQPFDQGAITKPDALFEVAEVRFKDGMVSHIGAIKNGNFTIGDQITLHVDEARRTFNSRNHSAGHLVDHAMNNLGINLIPGKAYHFPDGAYVEYEGLPDEATLATLKERVEEAANKLVEQALPVTIKLVTLEELKAISGYVPEYLPKDKLARAMIVQGYPAIPCGGTHVTNTKDVGHITIDKIRTKGGNLRVSYSILKQAF